MEHGIEHCPLFDCFIAGGSWSGADTSPIRIAGSILVSPFIKIRKDYARFVSPCVDCEPISVHLELNELILEHEDESGCSGKDSEREHSCNPLFHLDSRAQISRFVIVGRARWKSVELKCVESELEYRIFMKCR